MSNESNTLQPSKRDILVVLYSHYDPPANELTIQNYAGIQIDWQRNLLTEMEGDGLVERTDYICGQCYARHVAWRITAAGEAAME